MTDMKSNELLNLLEEEVDEDLRPSLLSPEVEILNLNDIGNMVKTFLGDGVYDAFVNYMMIGAPLDDLHKNQLKVFFGNRSDYVSQEILQSLLAGEENVGNGS